MASSSDGRKHKFDVFLSFRGKDTRDNFTSHLYNALNENKILTFIDNRLVIGEEISWAIYQNRVPNFLNSKFVVDFKKIPTFVVCFLKNSKFMV